MMKDGINVDQRDVILVPFPFSDLSNAKKRPAFVVSNNIFNTNGQDVVCCLITSNPENKDYTIDITNKDMESGFLEFDSKVKTYRIFTVSKSIIYKNLGKLNIKKSTQITNEIKKLVEISYSEPSK